MKKVIVKGFLYVCNEGQFHEYYCMYQQSGLSINYTRLVMPLNFEVEIPEPDAITPVTMLADESDFLAMRLKLQDERIGVAE